MFGIVIFRWPCLGLTLLQRDKRECRVWCNPKRVVIFGTETLGLKVGVLEKRSNHIMNRNHSFHFEFLQSISIRFQSPVHSLVQITSR